MGLCRAASRREASRGRTRMSPAQRTACRDTGGTCSGEANQSWVLRGLQFWETRTAYPSEATVNDSASTEIPKAEIGRHSMALGHQWVVCVELAVLLGSWGRRRPRWMGTGLRCLGSFLPSTGLLRSMRATYWWPQRSPGDPGPYTTGVWLWVQSLALLLFTAKPLNQVNQEVKEGLLVAQCSGGKQNHSLDKAGDPPWLFSGGIFWVSGRDWHLLARLGSILGSLSSVHWIMNKGRSFLLSVSFMFWIL